MSNPPSRPPVERPPFIVPDALSASRSLSGEEQKIQDALTTYASAFKAKSYDEIEKAVSDDFTLIQGGGAELTAAWSKQEFKDTQFKHMVDMFENVHYDIDLLSGQMTEAGATATFRFSVGGNAHGRTVSMDGVGTAVLQSDGNRLTVAHMHNSAQLSVKPG